MSKSDSLYFAPLPKKILNFDFAGGNQDVNWRIEGGIFRKNHDMLTRN